jgi:hypothetical protein
VACAAPASAAVVTAYNSLAAWTGAATGRVVLEDFADTTLATGLTVNPAGGAINNGKLDSALAVYGLCIGGGAGCPATTTFGFTPGTTAFSAEWDLEPGGRGNGIYFEITLAGGGVQTVSGITNPAGGTFAGFYGFVSDVAITGIRLGSGFTGQGETFDADNLRFTVAGGGGGGGGNPVPEPATFALVGLGLLAAKTASRSRS